MTEDWAIVGELDGARVYLTASYGQERGYWVEDLEELTLVFDSKAEGEGYLHGVRLDGGAAALGVSALRVERVE